MVAELVQQLELLQDRTASVNTMPASATVIDTPICIGNADGSQQPDSNI
jgi:hypothetical protein